MDTLNVAGFPFSLFSDTANLNLFSVSSLFPTPLRLRVTIGGEFPTMISFNSVRSPYLVTELSKISRHICSCRVTRHWDHQVKQLQISVATPCACGYLASLLYMSSEMSPISRTIFIRKPSCSNLADLTLMPTQKYQHLPKLGFRTVGSNDAVKK